MWLNNLTIIDPYTEAPFIEKGAIEIDAGRVKTVKTKPVPKKAGTVRDMGGKVVLPGMINAHTHLYSTLALGMPPPPSRTRSFKEILEKIWWPLDRALDEESIRASARVGMLESLRHGCTTIFDHHSSPLVTRGALDILAEEARDMGLRIAVALETSDRDGDDIFREQLKANIRAIKKYEHDPQVLPLMGLHASFTLGDSHLMEIAGIMTEFRGAGIHIHLSEAAADEEDALERGYASVVDRLDKFNLFSARSIVAHGVHIRPTDLDTLNRRKINLVHNPSSNANNAVGILPSETIRVMKAALGTDGMHFNMLREAREGTLLRSAAGEEARDYLQLLFEFNPAMVSRLFNSKIGHIQPGQPADLVFYDYTGRTGLSESNAAAHLLWGLGEPSDVMTAGVFRMEAGEWPDLDTKLIYATAKDQSHRLWDRIVENRS